MRAGHSRTRKRKMGVRESPQAWRRPIAPAVVGEAAVDAAAAAEPIPPRLRQHAPC